MFFILRALSVARGFRISGFRGLGLSIFGWNSCSPGSVLTQDLGLGF